MYCTHWMMLVGWTFLSRSAEEDDTQFRALEVLMLDDNRLTSGVFNSLTNLNRSQCGFLCYSLESQSFSLNVPHALNSSAVKCVLSVELQLKLVIEVWICGHLSHREMLSCIMGRVGSIVLEDYFTLGTKRWDVLASATSVLTITGK